MTEKRRKRNISSCSRKSVKNQYQQKYIISQDYNDIYETNTIFAK